MKSIKNLMLIAIVAMSILSVPQQAYSQESRAKEAPEQRMKKHPRKMRRGARVMNEKDFSMMYEIVKKSSFDNNKIDIIRVACIGSYFNSKQCARLLSLFSFSNSKLEVLEVVAPRLLNIDDFDRILEDFSFSSDREKAIKILARRKEKK